MHPLNVRHGLIARTFAVKSRVNISHMTHIANHVIKSSGFDSILTIGSFVLAKQKPGAFKASLVNLSF